MRPWSHTVSRRPVLPTTEKTGNHQPITPIRPHWCDPCTATGIVKIIRSHSGVRTRTRPRTIPSRVCGHSCNNWSPRHRRPVPSTFWRRVRRRNCPPSSGSIIRGCDCGVWCRPLVMRCRANNNEWRGSTKTLVVLLLVPFYERIVRYAMWPKILCSERKKRRSRPVGCVWVCI